MIKVGVIGAGLIGRERLEAVQKLVAKNHPVSIGGVYDASKELTQLGRCGFCHSGA